MVTVPYVRSEIDVIREQVSKNLGVPIERISVVHDPIGRVYNVTVEPEVKAHFIQIDVKVDLT